MGGARELSAGDTTSVPVEELDEVDRLGGLREGRCDAEGGVRGVVEPEGRGENGRETRWLPLSE